MSQKSIEIYYDIADIPGISDRNSFSKEALNFRNAAMAHVEKAMEAANAGSWEGAEIGADEVNFGFSVDDFDLAETTVRNAVAGTPFENIRQITRSDFSIEDMAEFVDDAQFQDTVKPMGIFEVIGLLVFRRMPKRFRKS